MQSTAVSPNPPSRDVNPNHLLYSLMIPAIIMPLAGWMFSVSLPIIRDDFGLSADVAAWIATAFSLPFMILMPVYGRISESLGKRRLLIWGISTFFLGSLLAIFTPNLPTLFVARAIQGIGVAGIVPLSLALITEVFPAGERGSAMGKWSTIGPITGVIGPILAGFIVARWGWQSAFVPPAVAALAGVTAVYFLIPSTSQAIQFDFLRSFDWIGVGLLSTTLTFLLFYLSSRPITGMPPLQDWRLGLLTILSLVAFVYYEQRKKRPFIRLHILKNRSLTIASLCALLRMMTLSGGLGFIMPLYLADIVNLTPTQSGFFLMANPAAMVIFVHLGGRLSDTLGSRTIGMIGFLVFSGVMGVLSRLPVEVPYWVIIATLLVFGAGAGFMLAAFHRAALNFVSEEDLGTASGLYSMIRFMGSALGAAVGGILLQFYSEQNNTTTLSAYQHVFIWFIGFTLIGFAIATLLPKER